MKTEETSLPNNEVVKLYYGDIHPTPAGQSMTTMSVLQLRKDGKCPEQFGMIFDRQVPEISKKFGQHLLDAEPHIAAIFTPPSESKQFQPFVEALMRLRADVQIIANAVTKPPGLESGDPKTTLDDLRQGFSVNVGELPALEADVCVCVLDDILGDGKTIAVMIEKLRPLLPANVRFIVACPLRIVKPA